MKGFKDLKFKKHHSGDGLMARIGIKNGYGVSVIKFKGSYGFQDDLWEVAILYNDSLTYNTDITDDVLGWQTEIEVSIVMQKAQLLS